MSMVRQFALLPALLLCAQIGIAEPVRLDLDEARALAVHHLNSGRPDLSETLARGLLLANPRDVPALVTLSRALRLQGRTTEAATAGRTAWRNAATDHEKYFAARTIAQALSSGGNRTRAQLWLRRAAQIAPDDRLRDGAVQDFRHVQRRNPLTSRFTFGVSPSNNLNNSPDADYVEAQGRLLPLSGTQRALSGTLIETGAALTWRKALSDRTLLRLGVEGEMSRARLSREARAQAPSLKNSDLSSDRVALGFGLTRRQDKGPLTMDLSIGKRWYGGEALAQTNRLTLGKTLKSGERSLLRFSGFAEDQTRLDDPLGSSTSLGTSLMWSTALQNGARLTLHGTLTDVDSDTHQIDQVSTRVGLAYEPGKPVLGARLTLTADLTRRDYRQINPHFDLFRDDRQTSFGVSAFFADHDLYGFAPTVDILARHNDSTLDVFDARELSISFGLRSAF